jgi:hypothetical protein
MRILCAKSTNYFLLKLLADFDAGDPNLHLELMPPPCLGWGHWTIQAIQSWEKKFNLDMTLERFGIFPGTTLIVQR